jgi:hypothetical protein
VQVDTFLDSRPILQRLGFTELAKTTRFGRPRVLRRIIYPSYPWCFLILPVLPARRQFLVSVHRVNGRRSRSRATARQGRHSRGGRELDNSAARKTARAALAGVLGERDGSACPTVWPGVRRGLPKAEPGADAGPAAPP